MENSEVEATLKQTSQNAPFTLPPHHHHPRRRRPLQSQTYRTLLTILSHCDALQSSPQPPQPPGVNDADKLGEGAEHEASVDYSGAELEISLVQQESPVDEGKQFNGFRDGGNGAVNEVDRLDRVDVTEQANEVVMQDNNVNFVDLSVVKNLTCDIPDEKDMGNVVDSHQEFSRRRELKVFNEPFVNEVPETVSSSVDMDVIADMSMPDKSSNEKSPAMEGHLTEGLEHELHLKQKELEKLLSTSGNLDLSLCDTEDGEIEEGEISGEVDEAKDLLFEDAVSLEEMQLDKVQISKHADNEVCTRDDGDARLGKCDARSSLFLDIRELETKSTTKEQQTSAEVFAHSKDIAISGWTTEQVSAVNKTDHPAISLENLGQLGLIQEDTTENKGDADTKMEASVSKNKKKRGALTKERRAKKKKKERIKRAEKNRKLGVKRLKLQPVLKPKTVTYCRHYLKGRCQEGEKCKFSHDTTPLTKSTPCSYFARHSCMKGDNCPFDHQLSKYPCNNIVTKGFCSRGADCLFSHEISRKDDSVPTSYMSKPEFKSPSLTSESNSKKQVNNQGMNNHGVPHQHVDAKCSPMKTFSGKSSEKKVSEHLDRPAAHMPKGICLISHVRSPPGITSKHEQAASHFKGDDSPKLSHSMTSNLVDCIQKSNDIAKGVPSKTPKGINFLSFGKHPLDDFLNRDKGVSESLLGQLGKSKLVDSSSSESGVKIVNQAGQSSSELEPNVKKIANIVSPLSKPESMKFLSFGKPAVGNPSAVSQADMLRDNVNMGLPQVHEKKNALDAVKSSHAMPHRLASSSSLFYQCLDQRGAGNCGGMSSSLKTSFLLNAPTSVQKALQSTLAFAAKLDSEIKLDQSLGAPSDMNIDESSTLRG